MRSPVSLPPWLFRLWPAFTFQFSFIAATALWKSAANAAVLGRFEARALPYLYVWSALSTAVWVGGLATWRLRLSPRWLAMGGAVVVFLLGGLLHWRLPIAPILLYVFAEAFATFLSIVFWGAMGESFDAREARRAFTVVSGVGMAGGMVGGWMAREWAYRGGVVGLCGLGSGLLLLGAFAFGYHSEASRTALEKAAPEPGALVRYLRGHGYPWALAGLVVCLSVLTSFSDYLFRVRAAEAFREEELAALFGGFQMWMAIFCVAWQLLVAERLLKRLGVIGYVFGVPLLLMPWTLAALLTPALWPAYGLRLLEMAASLSVLPVGMQLLYGPVPDGLRDTLRSSVDGLVKKGGVALGGLLLILVGPWAQSPALAGLALVLCVLSALAAWRLRPLYVRTLRDRVSGTSARDAFDEVTDQPLKRALESPSPGQVLHALALMEQVELTVTPYLPMLLRHRDERVQEKALLLSMRGAPPECFEAMVCLLAEGSLPVRKAAIWALAHLDIQKAEPLLAALFDAPEWEIRAAAVGAILAYGAPSEVWNRAQLVLQARVEMQELASVEKRRESAQLLGRARDRRYAAFLERYLHDDELSVRRAALVSVGQGRYLKLAPVLLSRLSSKDERRAARESLTQLGDEVVPLLREAMNDRQRPAPLRYEIPRVLRQIGTQAALESLLFSNVKDDAFLHYRIGVALSRLSEGRLGLKVDGAQVLAAIGRRKDTYRQWVTPFRDLRAALGEGALLTRALGDRLDQALELSFWLLGLLHDAQALRRVHAHLLGEDNRRRAFAREFLDHQLPHDEWLLIREQVEAHHRSLPPGAPGRLFDTLVRLSVSDDLVVRALARRLAKERGWEVPARGEDDMSDAMVERMMALEGVEIFAHCDVDDIAAVASLARELRVEKGTFIYREGDPGDALYVIVEGEIEALRSGRHVLTLQAKQAFGDVSLLDGAPRPTDMLAREACTLLLLDRRDFLDLVSDRPELLTGIYRTVARQLRQILDLPGQRGSLAG